MSDIIREVISNAWEEATNSYGEYFDVIDFEKSLEKQGFMVVPIEDPTNLFGVQEDSL